MDGLTTPLLRVCSLVPGKYIPPIYPLPPQPSHLPPTFCILPFQSGSYHVQWPKSRCSCPHAGTSHDRLFIHVLTSAVLDRVSRRLSENVDLAGWPGAMRMAFLVRVYGQHSFLYSAVYSSFIYFCTTKMCLLAAGATQQRCHCC